VLPILATPFFFSKLKVSNVVGAVGWGSAVCSSVVRRGRIVEADDCTSGRKVVLVLLRCFVTAETLGGREGGREEEHYNIMTARITYYAQTG